ncbi:NEDD8-activating enzyme E1 regulatory subunit [Haematococcus lacustris]|uniref:NEDD8-activating enzyme E1 regulatory subunit n=1 Tax=Haematococcus lacustris TaxID=44745 RepID=A0A6A0A387_HAELA|nr:NEDD8-activating enzyme E1 regulatory subunit [Haematococcus lacustris]
MCPTLQDDYLQEMVRFGAGELHVVAAFMGGMAAQEIIKLVTGQFTPVAGTLVYTAMGCTTSCFEF